MSDVRSRRGDVAQSSWLWGQRASCPLIATAWQPGTKLGSPRRLETCPTNPPRKESQELDPPMTLRDPPREEQTHE